MSDETTVSGALRYFLAPLAGFDGMELLVIQMPDGRCFLPIAAICQDTLKVQPQRQLQRLRASGTTARMVREFRIKTRQGMRQALCLDYDGLGHWLQMLNADKLPAGHHLKATLPRFQRAALQAVNAVLHGALPPLDPERAGPATAPRVTAEQAMRVVEGTTTYLEERQRRTEIAVAGHEQRLTELEDWVTQPYADAYVEEPNEGQNEDERAADGALVVVVVTCAHCGQRQRVQVRLAAGVVEAVEPDEPTR